jgi:glucose-6-phosphate isomerase
MLSGMNEKYYTHEVEDYAPYLRAAEEKQLFAMNVRSAFEKMQKSYDQNELPLLRACEKTEDLQQAEALVKPLVAGKECIVLLGTGGSGLGAAAAAQALGQGYPVPQTPGQPQFLVWDNLDAVTLHAGIRALPLEKTAFLIVSKSGGTLETLTQAYVISDYYDRQGKGELFNQSALVLTEPKDSPLLRFAKARNLPVLDHETEIGGRYSVISMTGIVPIYACGGDAKELREGALSVMNALKTAKDPLDFAPLHAAAALIGAEKSMRISAHVAKCYGDCFKRFGDWGRQLWAESLGKNNQGVLFAPAVGPLDQHSQLQLYLGGPNDKTYTVISRRGSGEAVGDVIRFPDVAAFGYLRGKHVGRVTEAERIATVESLRAAGRPVRVIETEPFNLRTLGALFMHFMLETIFAADLLGVNAFDQPAVEDGKIRARRILERA